MSTKPKRKAKQATTRKEKVKPARKRKPVEEKKEVVTPKKPHEKKVAELPPEKPLIFAVRLLGPFGVSSSAEYTLRSLRLGSRFRGVLLDKNDSNLGMLRSVKDYVAWGEIKSDGLAALLRKRGELVTGIPINDEFIKESFGSECIDELARAVARGQVSLKALREKGVSPVFRLSPPSGGFESSIKRPFTSRGELGNRGEKISYLVARMI
jgi:large subunit ribosomal protein L30